MPIASVIGEYWLRKQRKNKETQFNGKKVLVFFRFQNMMPQLVYDNTKAIFTELLGIIKRKK